MNFNFKKKYGQNFIQNTGVIQKIVWSINPDVNDLIIEIGPGSGALTRLLKKYGCKLFAIEIDEDTRNFLVPLEDDLTKIIYGDFLSMDLNSLISSVSYDKLYIIGNLPYYITTPIITKIIESKLPVSEMVFMVQDEVANRFSASPGSREYGSISVYLNYHFDVKKLFIVGKNNFIPVPGVDSAVIKLVSKECANLRSESFFNELIKNSFQFKRKNLRNNLRGYNLEKIDSILGDFGYSLANRAEDLPYQVFVEIANRY